MGGRTNSNLNFTSSIFRFLIANFSLQISGLNRKELNLQYAAPPGRDETRRDENSGPIQASLTKSIMSPPESDLAELPVLQYIDARGERRRDKPRGTNDFRLSGLATKERRRPQ